MTDKELTKFAAKAAGYAQHPDKGCEHLYLVNDYYRHWRPLIDNGAVFQLAVNLGMQIEVCHTQHVTRVVGYTSQTGTIVETEWHRDSSPDAATRRAIVRAAAEIGKGMK